MHTTWKGEILTAAACGLLVDQLATNLLKTESCQPNAPEARVSVIAMRSRDHRSNTLDFENWGETVVQPWPIAAQPGFIDRQYCAG